MTENILRIHFNGTEPNDFEPNVVELTEILPQVGFRPLADATKDSLPVGSVVLIYNCRNHTLSPIVVCEHHYEGFSYIHFSDLNYADPDIENMFKNYHFNDHLYKVFMQVAVIDTKPQPDLSPKLIAETGFRPLDEATPEDLPTGAVVLLYSAHSGQLIPLIVRVLSMSNKRFLYWDQSPIVVGDWHPQVIMDELKSFRNYSYLVIS